MAQYFKGDATELKYYESTTEITQTLGVELTEFFDEAYACFILGELIWDNELSPLSTAIPRDIFRESFSAIFDSFLFTGSFESYMTVFRSIFGEDVEVTFTVPAPGKLNIDIVALNVVLYDFVARYINDDEYILDEIIDDEGDNIAFQSIKGFESQYELERMLFEMVPVGIFTEITLTLGA